MRARRHGIVLRRIVPVRGDEGEGEHRDVPLAGERARRLQRLVPTLLQEHALSVQTEVADFERLEGEDGVHVEADHLQRHHVVEAADVLVVRGAARVLHLALRVVSRPAVAQRAEEVDIARVGGVQFLVELHAVADGLGLPDVRLVGDVVVFQRGRVLGGRGEFLGGVRHALDVVPQADDQLDSGLFGLAEKAPGLGRRRAPLREVRETRIPRLRVALRRSALLVPRAPADDRHLGTRQHRRAERDSKRTTASFGNLHRFHPFTSTFAQ